MSHGSNFVNRNFSGGGMGSLNRGGLTTLNRGGINHGSSFVNRNFSGAGRGTAGLTNLNRSGAGLGTHTGSSFVNRNFSGAGRGTAGLTNLNRTGAGLGTHTGSNFVNRNFGHAASGQTGGLRNTGLGHQSFSSQLGRGNFGTAGAGGLHHNAFAASSSGHGGLGGANLAHGLHGNTGLGGSALHNGSFGHNGNFGGGNFGGGNFNRGLNGSFHHANFVAGNGTRWSGGWNRWNNRSYFFGGRSPFGNYYRGYYPGGWGYGGWGYGYGRYGYGRFGFWPFFGLGYGLGWLWPYYYGYGYGYPYYGYPYYGYSSYLAYPYYGYGYGNSYYGGYGGYAGYGGYGGYGGYASSPLYSNTYNYYGAYGYPTYDTYAAAGAGGPTAAPTPDNSNVAPAEAGSTPPKSVADMTAADFAGQGEIDFKAGKYEQAVRDFRHALIDDPANAGVLMTMGQALFAAGQYDEAAGATAMAMSALPSDKWGAVVENYTQLYGNPADYATQLAALEKARDAKPESPALHFLLGFNYGFSGHKGEAIRELDKAVQLEPRDKGAERLRDLFSGKKPEQSAPQQGAPAAPQPQFPGGPQQQQLQPPRLPADQPTLNKPVNRAATDA